jgi:hypothetical protein
MKKIPKNTFFSFDPDIMNFHIFSQNVAIFVRICRAVWML